MTLLENWRKDAYENEDAEANRKLWQQYFADEKGIYKKVLAAGEPYKGTVKELADTFGVDLETMTGYLDGINDSLKEPNPIETMDENTEVSLDFDKEKLFCNMVACKATWLYELPEWDALLDEKTRKELWLKQKKSGTIVKPKKIGRNDPCPCGSGKKYKNCCGRPGLRKYDA